MDEVSVPCRGLDGSSFMVFEMFVRILIRMCVEMWCRCWSLLLSYREKRKQNSRRVMLSISQLANFQENGSGLVEG